MQAWRKMFALGIVARAIDFVAAALFAQIAERLARHAQRIVDFDAASPCGFPFTFERDLALFQARLLAAQGFYLLLLLERLRVDLLALGGDFPRLAIERGVARRKFLLLFGEACRFCCGVRAAFLQLREVGATAGQFLLRSGRTLAQFGNARGGFGNLAFGSVAGGAGFGALSCRGFHAPVRRAALGAQAGEIALAIGQFHSQSREFAVLLFAQVRGADHRFFRVQLIGGDAIERFGCGEDFALEVAERGLRFAGFAFEAQYVGVEFAQFALHHQRSGFGGASAADHAALIAGAVGGDEMLRGMLSRQLLSRCRRFH
jgi:hypothetical protein